MWFFIKFKDIHNFQMFPGRESSKGKFIVDKV